MSTNRQGPDGACRRHPAAHPDRARRQFLRASLGFGAAMLGADSARSAASGERQAPAASRLAAGPRTLDGFPAWLAADAGLVASPGLETAAGPDAPLDALLRGDCEFAQSGVAAVAAAVLAGRDPVIVLSPADPHRAGALFSLSHLRSPQDLANARVGVANETGTSARSAQAVMQNFGIRAALVPLGSPAAASAALAERRIDAAYLPVELGYRGRREFGWNMFEGGMLGVPGGLVTTRRFAAKHPQRVASVLAGVVAAIHRFKTRPESTSLALQRYLQTSSIDVVADLQSLYAPIFRATPSPTLFFALPGLRQGLAARFPDAGRLQSDDLVDGSFIDALSRSGVIERLYRPNG